MKRSLSPTQSNCRTYSQKAILISFSSLLEWLSQEAGLVWTFCLCKNNLEHQLFAMKPRKIGPEAERERNRVREREIERETDWQTASRPASCPKGFRSGLPDRTERHKKSITFVLSLCTQSAVVISGNGNMKYWVFSSVCRQTKEQGTLHQSSSSIPTMCFTWSK